MLLTPHDLSSQADKTGKALGKALVDVQVHVMPKPQRHAPGAGGGGGGGGE